MNKKITWIIISLAIVAIVVLGIIWLYQSQHEKAVKLEAFAQCITNSGAKFYGAFWCPHCQAQKAEFNTLFETGADKLPYVECSTPDTNSQLQVCNDEGVTTYPTWKFSDGSVKQGEVSFAVLADKTGCTLPK